MTENRKAVEILVVESQAPVAADLESQLTGLGYTVCGRADTAEEAVRLFEAHRPNLVLMDVTLQGERDGIRAAEDIHEKGAVPVVFLADDEGADQLELAKPAAPFGYLLKPFRTRDLKITVEVALHTGKIDWDRRLAEAALRESEEWFRKIYYHMPVGVARVSLDFNIESANETYCRMLGYTEEELIGKSIQDITHADMVEVNQQMHRWLSSGEIDYFHLEKQFVHKSGRIIHCILDTNLVRDAEGRPAYTLGSLLDITDHKQADEALRKSEERFSLAMEASKDGLWDWNITTNQVYYSPGYASMLGYSPGEAPAHISFWADLIHPDDREAAISSDWACIENKCDDFETELRMRAKNGEWRWILRRGKAVQRDDAGRAVRMIGTHVDVTDRKLAEHALVNSEKRWRNILVNTPQIGIALNSEGQIIFANDHFLNLTGYTQREVIGGDWFAMFIPLQIREKVRDIFHYVMSTKATHGFSNYENDILTKSGEARSVFWSNLLTYDIEGNIQDITCLGVDLTERKKAEEALKASEERFLTVLNSIEANVYVSDFDTNEIIFMNKAMVDNFGADLTGQACWKALRGGDRPCDFCVNSRLVGDQGDPLDTVVWHDLNPIVRRHYINYDRAIKWTDGRLVKIQISSDITEYRKMEKELQQAQKMEAVGTLAGGVSHDFNNLLQAINGYTELLLMDKTADDADYGNLLAIRGAGKKAAELVRQLLLFCRKTETEHKPIELNHEVEYAINILRRTIPKMIDIEAHLADRLWVVEADPVQMEQILLNLGGNAADAMPSGGRLIIETENVTLGEDGPPSNMGAPSGCYVLLKVSDTGHGMTKETMEKIFEPFFTTKEIGQGTGLGLASVYGIVKSHGGFITCYSEVDQGTTFKIFLPAIEIEGSPGHKASQTWPPRGHREKILLVDDEESIRNFARQALQSFGYQVLTAANGEEALKTYAGLSKEIKMVVLDIGMPGMGGHKCLQELIKLDPAVKVLLASGYSINGQVKQSLEIGAAGFVGKPYQLNDLLIRVRKILDA